ncbi:unnamed protein product [Ectocarpus sp. 8 AP-2014]
MFLFCSILRYLHPSHASQVSGGGDGRKQSAHVGFERTMLTAVRPPFQYKFTRKLVQPAVLCSSQVIMVCTCTVLAWCACSHAQDCCTMLLVGMYIGFRFQRWSAFLLLR